MMVYKAIAKLCLVRKYSVRVRFAPSPTGFLHLGGLRTALYNFLFAKAHKGKFLLRIEDTDRTRIIPDAAVQLEKDLLWAGIEIDEGPSNPGDYGPYVQSNRLDIYKKQLEILVDKKVAYPCFCTDRRLGMIRREAVKNSQIPKYDNRCRHLSDEEVKKRLSRNEAHCFRFKLEPNCETFDDLIYGTIAYDVALNEGDPVIMKADGFPTYHFANVVDDYLMKITHVLRGVEWQISTTKHILLYRAFGWEPPVFGHLPLLLNSDGSKLSKRQGDIQISHYRETGILPQALINFVTYSGGGFNKPQGHKLESYSMEELIEKFDVSRINAHSTKMMPEMLLELNKLEIYRLLKHETSSSKLTKELIELIKRKYPEKWRDGTLDLSTDHVLNILNWSNHRIHKLSDLISRDFSFLWINPKFDDKHFTQLELDTIKHVAEQLKSQNNELSKATIKTVFESTCSDKNINFGTLMALMRRAISGLKEGPGVAEMIELLGKSKTLNRLQNVIKK